MKKNRFVNGEKLLKMKSFVLKTLVLWTTLLNLGWTHDYAYRIRSRSSFHPPQSRIDWRNPYPRQHQQHPYQKHHHQRQSYHSRHQRKKLNSQDYSRQLHNQQRHLNQKSRNSKRLNARGREQLDHDHGELMKRSNFLKISLKIFAINTSASTIAVPNHCWYQGYKYECGLSLSCVFEGNHALDLCNGGMIWTCCVPSHRYHGGQSANSTSILNSSKCNNCQQIWSDKNKPENVLKWRRRKI